MKNLSFSIQKPFYGYALGILLLLIANFDAISQTKTLNYYLNTALANSPLLKDHANQIAISSIDSQRLHAAYKPQVTGVSNNAYSPVINGWGYDATLSNIGSFNEMVNVGQNFVSKKNIGQQNKSFNLFRDSIQNAGKLAEQELKRSITAQYITAYGDLQQLSFYTEVSKILINEEMILKKLTENNIYRQTDYLTFIVTMKQQELQLKQLQIQFRNDYYLLNYLCGIFDTSEATLADPDISMQLNTDTAASAFFRQYQINHLKLENDFTLIDFSYKPKVNAFANAGYSSTLLYNAYKNFGSSAGINLTIPIYDGHQKQMLQRKIKLAEVTNENYKGFFTSQYSQQLAMLRQQLMATESLLGDIEDQIKYADGLVKVNSKLMETGDARISDLVLAVNNYLNARNLLTQNKISRMQVLNQINYWNR